MAELHLILTPRGTEAGATSVAISDIGMAVSSIAPQALDTLLSVRAQLEAMMKGSSPRMSANDLTAFGRAMGKILFADDVRDAFTDAANGQKSLIAKILATSDDLKSIPWEYTAWPSNSDAPRLNNTVVRIVTHGARALVPIDKNDGLRVLMLSASPLGLDGIPWSNIRDSLVNAFRRVQDLEVITDDGAPTKKDILRIVEAASPAKLRSAIRKDDPHVVQFVGHGTNNGIALVNSKDSSAALLSSEGFNAALLTAPSLRLVILSACDTANPGIGITPTDATIGTFAEQVVRNGAPAVVASQMVINNRTIAIFCDALYSELLSSGSIDLAVAAGRCAVAAELSAPDSAAIEWGIPVLYRRLGAAQIFQ